MSITQRTHSRGILLLLITTLIWGTSFPVLKFALISLSPAVILAVRFSIAAVAFVPFLRKLTPRLIRDGVLLGCLYFAECTLALKGLESISANRSAFIISLNVILVPLLGALLGQRLRVQTVIAATLAIGGIAVMSWEGSGLSQGDYLTFACALGVAIYILILGAVTSQHPTLPLVSVLLLVMALLSLVWAIPQLTSQMAAIAHHWGTLSYLGLIVTATPIWTQAFAQRSVLAHEAASLYTLEPVFAMVFSFYLLGETLSQRGVMGAGLTLVAILCSQSRR